MARKMKQAGRLQSVRLVLRIATPMAKHGRYPKVRVDNPPAPRLRPKTKAQLALDRRHFAASGKYVGTPYRIPAKLRRSWSLRFATTCMPRADLEDFYRNRGQRLRDVVREIDPENAIRPYSRW